MTTKLIGTLLTLVLLSSCTQRTNNNQVDNITTDSVQTENSPTPEKRDSCIAKPVIKKSIYSTSTFKLSSDKRVGTETLELKNGDKLTINISIGDDCNYTYLTFRFETSRFKADTTDINYWVDKGLQLMKEIDNGLDAPLDIPSGTPAAKSYLKEKGENPLELKEWIQYGNGTIKNTLTIERVQKLLDKGFAIELMYSGSTL